MIPINPNYTKPEEKLCYILGQLRNNGIIVETKEGMRYLKGEEFDSFFGVNDADKAQMDSILLRNNPYTSKLAESMRNTREALAASILKGAFNGTNT
jgi:hypothetical protein